MIIIHCLKKSNFEKIKNDEFYGDQSVMADGFIHCSDPVNFHKVARNFKKVTEDLVFLVIDSTRVIPKVIWEDDGGYGTEYPHIYGKLNMSAVINVLPFVRD